MKAIITADLHLRNDRPRCRLDENWLNTQKKVLQYIVNTANEKDVDVIIVGDIFHTSRQPAEIINIAIDTLKGVNNKVLITYGQHDLPYHLYANENRSAYGVLKRIFTEIRETDLDTEMLFLHKLIFPNEKSRPVKEAGLTADELLNECVMAKWIFTGDYHHHFHYEKDGRHVVNPGCITRQATDFINYKPIVYYVDTDKEIVEAAPLPDTENVIADAYVKDEKERNDRIESFISMIQKQGKVTLNFIDNLKERLDGLKGMDKDVLMEVIEEIK